MKIFSHNAVGLMIFSAICFATFSSNFSTKDVNQNLGKAFEIQIKEQKLAPNNDVAIVRAAYRAARFAIHYTLQASCNQVLHNASTLFADSDEEDVLTAVSRKKSLESRMAAL